MPLKFCCNISWLFTEHDFLDRFRVAAEAGFKGVEIANPFEYSIEELSTAKEDAGIEVVQINSPAGTRHGCASVPGFEDTFEKDVNVSLQYADALQCKRIHLMGGKFKDDSDRINIQEYEDTCVSNLIKASKMLEKTEKIGLLEFINNKSNGIPLFFLNTPVQAETILNKVNKKNIQLQLDMFHLQIMCGNLTTNIQKYLPITGHIQVSQVPDRHEPDTHGEVDYEYIFQLLSDLGYEHWIGTEYKPKGKTVDGLQWLKNFIE